MTGDKRANLYSKKRLGLATLRDRILGASYEYVRDLARSVWGRSGWFQAVGIAAGPGSVITLAPAATGVTYAGHFVNLGALPVADRVNLPLEGDLGSVYHIGYVYAEIPSGVEINPRTGKPYYTDLEDAAGALGTPDAVVDNGDGTLTLTVDTILDPGGAPRNGAGRVIRAWMVADPIAGYPASAVETVAFEEQTVSWDGAHNTIRTTALFGQTAASVDPAKYAVLARGPIISRNTDLRTIQSVIYAGNVTGDGAGNPPVAIDTADQQVLFYGVLGYLSDVLAVDPHGKAKIQVRACAADGGAGVYQITVQSPAGTWTFRVDAAGGIDFQDPATSKTTRIAQSGGTFLIDLLDALGTLDLKGTNSPVVQFGGQLNSPARKITFKDVFAAAGIDFTTGVWDAALDAALPTSIVGAINRQVEYKDAIDGMIGDSILGGAGCSDGGGLDLDIGSANYLIDGRYWSVDGTTLVLPDASTSYVYLRGVDQTYQRTAALPVPASCVLISKAVTAAGAITEIVDLRNTSSGLHLKTPILVGPSGHFSNVWLAVKAIGEWISPAAGTGAGRGWQILVVGETVEPDTITMPCNGIEIRGVPGQGILTWDFDEPLFDLNGRNDLTFENLTLKAIHANEPPVDQDRVVWNAANGAGDVFRLRIRDIEVTRDVKPVSGIFRVAAGGSNIYDSSIERVTCWEVRDFGIDTVYVNGLRLCDCRIKRQGAHTGGSLDMLVRIRGLNAEIVGGVYDGAEGVGIALGESGATPATDVMVSNVRVVAAGSHALLIEDVSTHCKATACYFEGGSDGSIVVQVLGQHNTILACRVKSLSAALARIGISLGAEKDHLIGNDVTITTGGGGTEWGIQILAAADHAIVIGNQTNGGGLDTAAAAPTIEHNRDDV